MFYDEFGDPYPSNMLHEHMIYNEYIVDHKPLADKRGTFDWAWMGGHRWHGWWDTSSVEVLPYNPMRHENHEEL